MSEASMLKTERARAMLDWMRDRPNEPFTKVELAEGLGRSAASRTLSEDLALARHLALEEDTQITYSHIDERGYHVYVYETPVREQPQGLRGLVIQQRAGNTGARNRSKAARWEERHAMSEDDRSLARGMAEANEAMVTIGGVMASLMERFGGRPT